MIFVSARHRAAHSCHAVQLTSAVPVLDVVMLLDVTAVVFVVALRDLIGLF